MDLNELKNIFTQLITNLDNNIVKKQISNKDAKFDFKLLSSSIENYLENFEILKKTRTEENIQEIHTKAKRLLQLTNDEHVGLYAVEFTQNGNYLIKHAPVSEVKNDRDINSQLKKEIGWYQSTISQYQDWIKSQNVQLSPVDKAHIKNVINEYEKLKPVIEKIQKDTKVSSEYLTYLKQISTRRIEEEKNIQDITNKLLKQSSHSEKEVSEDNSFKLGSSTLSGTSTLSASATTSESGVKRKNLHLDSHELNIIKKEEISPVLGVNKIASVLSSIIEKQPIDSGMMIGIFGKWGRGKTYLFDRIVDYIKNESSVEKNYKIIRFSAWKYQKTNASWGYLYERFLESYLNEHQNSRCFKWCQKTWKILKLNLVRIGLLPIGIFASSLILYLVWLFFIDKIGFIKFTLSSIGIIVFIKLLIIYINYKTPAINLFKKYFSQKNFTHILGFQAEVQKDLKLLLKQWIPDENKDEKIILFVDDLDRCHPEQIIDVLDGLRIILDEESLYSRLIIVTAIDEEILKYALEKKYEGFYNNDKNTKNIFKEYLEKVFLVGIKLNNLTNKESRQMLDEIIIASTVKKNKAEQEKASVGNKDSATTQDDNNEYASSNHVVDTFKFVQSIEIDDADEKKYLLDRVSDLHNNTPRKIRIFYYKYLIFKKLLSLRFSELDMLEEWDKINYKHVIIDMLIDASNGKLKSSYTEIGNGDLEGNMYDEIKYVVEMISVL